MPARRHRFAKCQHLGFGVECHRCAQANTLDAKIAAHPKDKDAQAWANEAARLRGPAGKKPAVVAPATKPYQPYGDPSWD